MTCLQCQTENLPAARFCQRCGASLGVRCASCGADAAAGARFCSLCGHGLVESDPAVSRGATAAAYTPGHLTGTLLTSRTAAEGERKPVTVLFCDLADSTALAERVGPDAMHALLNRFFELALAEVHRYGGTINQFLGDGFMALFGAPLAHEDHARRAVLAAEAIRRGVHEPRGAPGGEPLSVRIGLNTGLVVVGTIGDNLRVDYTAVGDTTNLAARLQQAAEPGAVYLSEATQRMVE
jgi:class 3 adenylate cyclase